MVAAAEAWRLAEKVMKKTAKTEAKDEGIILTPNCRLAIVTL